MNRETKIGLLVGLAFIIVIGVLLSDHIQTSTQIRPAVLGSSGEVVRTGTAAPGTEHPGAAKIVPPARIEPTGQVATSDSLEAGNGAQQEIVIGPAGAAGNAAGANAGVTNAIGANGGQVAVGPMTDGVVLTPGANTGPNAGTAGAQSSSLMSSNLVTPVPGQEVAKVEPLPLNTAGEADPKGTIAPPRTHTAVAGDSVYKMAVKYYGGYTKAREAMIVGANPSLAKGGKIVVGKQYVIPNLPGQAAVPVETASTDTAVKQAPHAAPVQTAKVAAKTGGSTYTVKSGDSLAKIAGKAGVSVAQLKAANKDVLNGSDKLQIGMTLKMPEKQVAVAN